ncbi:MAG TPA: helix-turn-helix transcriptional regulator [Oscillatoriales cyanobacterium M59_W2019_021]|nr:MAG: XRE family transcriptional regulator [Cyanobacteria bacterium J055]HIK30534.1 helix-turn-helix transcriptional regulator [Oscillatoriales cyanobacterium M4454_W2019_049]HIK49773.1 helix-turn-helix transcriptional regulator [Oscillatoriales cyanobacterium M59_W2019_021]
MTEDPRQIVGKHIRDLRQQAGISQEKLAEICGLHRTYIGAVERGERNVSLLNIVVLARALNVRPAKLLERIN